MLFNQVKDPVYEQISARIAQIAQGNAPAEMLGAIGIAAGAAQRALPRNLD
jgi:hypothetical protein